MTLLEKSVLAAKVEVTPGTAVSPSGSDATFNVFNAKMFPDVEFTARDRQIHFGELPSIPGCTLGKCTFSTNLSGGSSVPAHLALFLPACGWVATAGVFSPVTAIPGVSSVTNITMSHYEDGVLKKMRGCAGTWTLRQETGKVVWIDWEFMGVWMASLPSDTGLISPTFAAETPLRFANAGLTIGSWAPLLSKLTIAAGNKVTMRYDPSAADGSGYVNAVITQRQMTGSADPESTLVATNALHSDLLTPTTRALAYSLASGGHGVAFAAPKLQYVAAPTGDRDGFQTDEINFKLHPSSGDDEFTWTVT